MKLPENIQSLEIHYDGRCAICCTFHEWLSRQPRAFPVRFLAYQSDESERVFPGVGSLDPDRDLIVRTDEGEVYRGEEAWVLCLLSCRDYQAWARRLASPKLLPLAKKMCSLIASNRLTLSKLFFKKKNEDLAKAIHKMPEQECGGGCPIEGARGHRREMKRDIPDGLL